MAFNFGQTTQPTLGFNTAQQNKPMFGSTFGTGATTTGFSGFGTQNTQPATTQATFGGFGATQTTFGASQPTAATNTGFSFGNTNPPNTSFGFATNPTPASTFGNTTANTGFTFGQPTATTSSFGFGGFGQTNTATTSAPLFGGFNTQTTGSLFGKPATTTSTFSFNQPNATFGQTGFNNTGLFGAGQTGLPGQTAQQPVDPNFSVVNSVLNVKIFNDERDQILSKFNLLQASWGVGKGHYSQNQAPVEYTPENPYCRFKALVFAPLPGKENKHGVVSLVFNKKDTEVKAQSAQIQSQITNALGNKPELTVIVDEIKPIANAKSQMLVHVVERAANAERNVPANDLSNFFNQPMPKQQLTNQGVASILPFVRPEAEAIADYLKCPPSGIDPRIWTQAIQDNPDATKYVPVPVVGFAQLKERMRMQEHETALHRAYLSGVGEDVEKLKLKTVTSATKVAELKKKHLELSHRLLKVLVNQEITRKIGMALQPLEEQLRIQLENMQAQLSIPTQFRSRLTELLANVRIQRLGDDGEIVTRHVAYDRYKLDPCVNDDLKQFLKMEQTGINYLIDVINADLKHLQVIKHGMEQLANEFGQ